MTEILIRIILDILVIVFIILGILWKVVKGKKTNQANHPNPGTPDLEMIPGHSTECQQRGEAITKLTTSYEFLVESINRIDKTVCKIWERMDKDGTS